jgi:hypothetical protein
MFVNFVITQMTKRYTLWFCALCVSFFAHAQVKLNEVLYRNPHQWADNYGDYAGWVELYNTGSNTSLGGYRIGQSPQFEKALQLPFEELQAGVHRLMYTSGLNEPGSAHITTQDMTQYRTVIDEQGPWRYAQGTSNVPSDWMQPAFDDSVWLLANGSVGYGDNDDQVIIPQWFSVGMRTNFELIDTTDIACLFFNIDYDDGFILYLNGVEIARRGFQPLQKDIGFFDQSNGHEALMYQGLLPELILPNMDLVRSLWRLGTKVLAVQVNNTILGYDDMTLRLWAHIGLKQPANDYLNNPTWFQNPQAQAAFQNLHTHFKIKEGETVYLFNPAGAVVDSLYVSITAPAHAWVRSTDGSGNWLITETPTPGTTNGNQTCCEG